MREVFIQGSNLVDGYHKAIIALKRQGDVVECPDYNQKQLECSMTICIENPLAEPRISRCIIGGAYELQQYKMEILEGILDFMVGKDEHIWPYTYFGRYSYQVPFIVSELKRNPLTRRAIMNIRDFEVDSKNSDPACWQSCQYFIRDNKLHCKVLFRSNDLTEAFFYNAFAFICLQEKVANELGIEIGSYTHRSNSMHCYEKDFGLLDSYVSGILSRSLNDITYNYEDEYKEIMEEAIPEIKKMIKEKKERYGVVD